MPPIILKYKNYIILGLAAVALIFIGMSFFGDDAGAPGGDGEEAVAVDTESAQIERELLDELLRLRSIELDEALFGTPLFISLVDFSKPLVEQPVGRNNPFLPIGTQVEQPAPQEPAATP